jgi:hypothetical protein
MFEEPFLSPENNLWFFFSGHGVRHDERDYLLPIDANPQYIDDTGITIDFVTRRLSRSGAGNVVLILDACRNVSEGGKGGDALGEEAKERVRERGLISIFSCRPEEQSWEEDVLGQGIFTFAFLKALAEGNCATVRQINSYLKQEVPALARRYGKLAQTPWMVAEPIEKADLILSLKNVKEADLDGLKKAALEQEVEENFDSALELWNRVNIASQGRDNQFYAAFRRIERKRLLQAEQRERAEQEQKQPLAAEQREKERLAVEVRQREEKERLGAEQREKERLEAEQREKERLEAEQREKERLEAEQRDKERLDAEMREKERLEAEQRDGWQAEQLAGDTAHPEFAGKASVTATFFGVVLFGLGIFSGLVGLLGLWVISMNPAREFRVDNLLVVCLSSFLTWLFMWAGAKTRRSRARKR